jgi:hypothetical protein
MVSPAGFDGDNPRDEETPLLGVQRDDTRPKKTLSIAQVSLLCLPWAAEAVLSMSISPYINEV